MLQWCNDALWRKNVTRYIVEMCDISIRRFEHRNISHKQKAFCFNIYVYGSETKSSLFKSKYSEIRNWSNCEASVVNRIVTRVCRYTPNYLWWWWNITPGFQKQGKWPCNMLISFKFGRRNENVRQVAGERITHLLQNTGLCNLHTNQVPAFSLKRSLRLNKSTIFRTTQALMPRYCQ